MAARKPTPQGQAKPRYQIRWMDSRDMDEVLAIERESFEFAWSYDDFIRALRAKNVMGMVAEHDERVVGFMIYELHQTRLHVLNFAVAAAYRRQEVGRCMVDKLTGTLSTQRRSRILLEVRETNLAMQQFLRAMGFKAISVLRDFYEDTDYVFQYLVGVAALAGTETRRR